MASRVNVVVSGTEAVGRWDQRVPDAYSRGALHEICAADTAGGWGSFWQARAHMALDEFDAMPQLEEAFSALRAEGAMAGCDLVARTAVIAIYCSEVSYVGLAAWLARSTWGRMPSAELDDASARIWWLAGELFRVYAHAATEYRTPTTFAIRDALLALVSTRLPPIDADACLIGVAALLEYAEFEDDGRLFDRLVAGILPWLVADAGSPLLRGWVWYRIHRCARSIGPVRGRGLQRIDAADAEARAFALAESHGLRRLRGLLLVTRCFYAHIARDEATAQRALRELGESTDFQRPLPAAWYYFLRGLAATREEEETQALLYFGQAVEAADSGELPLSSQQNFVLSHATALAQTGRWAEACDRFDRLIAQQSGRDRDITECRRRIAEFHRALAEAPEQARALRAEILARARAIRWLSFGLLTPRSTARFLVDALREGQAPDFIAQVVRQRRLAAEPAYPRAWPWPVRIESLGALRIAVDDAPVAFGSRPQRKPLEVLMLLIALGPHPVPSNTLMDTLWPGADGDRARSSLDMAVLRLRRLLRHDDVLRVEGGHLSLDRTRVWVDAWAFLDDESVAYAGSFLDGETQHEAVDALRRRLRALLVQRSRHRGDMLEAAGRSAQALAVYEAALLHDDLAEVLHRGVIRCHLALGEPAAAMRAFQRCRACLEHGLGVPPAPATQALVQELGPNGKAPSRSNSASS